jgi:hypothetical protein
VTLRSHAQRETAIARAVVRHPCYIRHEDVGSRDAGAHPARLANPVAPPIQSRYAFERDRSAAGDCECRSRSRVSKLFR